MANAGRPWDIRRWRGAAADTEYVRLALLCERAGHVLGLAMDSNAPHRLTLSVTQADGGARIVAPFDPMHSDLAAAALIDRLGEAI